MAAPSASEETDHPRVFTKWWLAVERSEPPDSSQAHLKASMAVRECMEIAWRTETGHEIVAGLSFYGWFPSLRTTIDVLSIAPSLAQPSCSIQVEQIELTDEAAYTLVDHGSILICDVRLHDWPPASSWPDFVKQILSGFVNADAEVAWCGNELCAHSPDIFIPETQTGDVYAAFSNHAGYVCRSPELTDEYVPLCDRDLPLCQEELRLTSRIALCDLCVSVVH